MGPGKGVNVVILKYNFVTLLKARRDTFATTNFLNTINFKIMGNLLYIIAVILVIAWAIGFLGFQAGGIIHVLLIIAIIAVLFRVISGRSAV